MKRGIFGHKRIRVERATMYTRSQPELHDGVRLVDRCARRSRSRLQSLGTAPRRETDDLRRSCVFRDHPGRGMEAKHLSARSDTVLENGSRHVILVLNGTAHLLIVHLQGLDVGGEGIGGLHGASSSSRSGAVKRIQNVLAQISTGFRLVSGISTRFCADRRTSPLHSVQELTSDKKKNYKSGIISEI